MCIAILNTPNVTFSKDLIRNCWESNSDGAGLIYTDTNNKVLHTFKEVKSLKIFYNKYIDVRRRFPKSNIVLHFRISTSGGVNETNTHPFITNKNLAFVHNGIISELNGIDAKRSDTNLFNENVLKHLGNNFLTNPAILTLIKKFIGHSKLVFLDSDNNYTIVNEQLGKRDNKYEGCWFSNSTYERVNYYDRGGVKVWKNQATHNPSPKGKIVATKVDAKTSQQYWDWSDSDWDDDTYYSGRMTDLSWNVHTKKMQEQDEMDAKRFDELSKKDITAMTDAEWREYEYLKWYAGDIPYKK